MVESDDDGASLSDVELLEISREEAQRTIDRQIETLDDIDDKAVKILRLNLVLIGILLTGISIASSEYGDGFGTLQTVFNWYISAGLLSIIASTALAAFTYTASSKRGGMSSRDIKELVENDLPPETNLEGIVESYADWIQYNYEVNTKNAPLGTGILLLLLYGLILVAVGVYHGFVEETGYGTIVAVIGILLLCTWRSGIVSQTRRYFRHSDADPRDPMTWGPVRTVRSYVSSNGSDTAED